MLYENRTIKKKSIRPLLVILMVILLIGMLPITALADSPVSNSTIVSSSVPSTIIAGTTYNIKVTFKNTGSEKWTAASGYSLVNAGDSNIKILSGSVLKKSEAIKVNGKKTFTLKIAMPAQAGTYSLKLKMAKGNTTFGAALEKTITVTPIQLTRITISHAAKKTAYNTFEKLDLTGLAVKGTYNNGTKQTLKITADNISGFNSSIPVKSQKLTISVNGVKATYKIKIVANTLKSISITSMPTKLSYYVGDTLDITGLSVTGKYKNGKTGSLSISPANILGFDTSVPADTQVLTVSVGGLTAQFSISIAQNKANIATAAVAKAEGSRLQADVDAAQALVSALPEGTVKTSLQNRLDTLKAAIALQTAKSASHNALQTAFGGYKDSDYSTPNWAALTSAKSNGDTAIDAAASITAVNTARENALAAMAAVKTLAQELADAKTAAHTALRTAFGGYNESDYSAADWATLTNAKSSGDTAIEASASISDVNTAKEDALDAMAAVKTLAKELAEAKTAAHTALDTALGGYTESNYSAANWITLTNAKSNGDTAIDAAASISDVGIAKGDALDTMAAVKTLAQELADAKTAAHAALEAALGVYKESDYNAANWITLTNAKSNGDTAIEAAVTVSGVNTAKGNALAAMNGVKTLQQELDAAKTAAHTKLKTAYDTYDYHLYTMDGYIAIFSAKGDGDTAIEDAVTIDNVNKAEADAETAMAAVPTRANDLTGVIDEDRQALEDAYNTYNKDDYTSDDYDKISQAYQDADTAIGSATTVAEADMALSNGKNAMKASVGAGD